MLIKYIELYPEREEDMSFGKFLRYNGIECIYDGTHGYFDIDRERSADKNE